jgi:hypothetical protein
MDFVDEGLERKLAGPGAGDEDHVAPGRHVQGVPVQDRLDPAAKPIAHHRYAYRSGDRDPDSRPATAFRDETRQRGAGSALPAPGHSSEIAAAAERVVGSHAAAVSRRSDRKAVTALLAAGGEDAASVLGGHPFEEAMDALAASIMRLIGPLHERVLLGADPTRRTPSGAT